MKIIIGANSFLSSCLVENWHAQPITLVGRAHPKEFLEIDSTELAFVETDYHNAKEVASVLMNNSNIEVIFVGISSEPALLINADTTLLIEEFKSNVIFSLEIIKCLLPEMIRQNYGRFIFIGSQESDNGVIGGVGYSMIKNSQKAISTNVAIEYSRFNITSNIVRIGYLGGGYSLKLSDKRKQELTKAQDGSFRTNPQCIGSAINEILQDKNINGKIFDV